ncbi:MAG TPA: CinA family nicotinamide mononucleotide deamidase-related protein [Flavisolibacter sp.]|nr:CinA family nicotinamide mononucleotide deamidase-related protein [Flavisolibacter sp.]
MKEVNAVIITIGDELLIGQTVDTNSAFIGRELNKVGVWIKRRVAIGDTREEILSALEEQKGKAEIVIITGGLGPTADDITKPALCAFFDSRLVRDEGVEKHVAAIFARSNRAVTERNRQQADVPHNCTVLHNERGTAPGMWFDREGIVYVSLPGVPVEMMGLIETEVVPRLQKRFTLPAIIHKTVITFGLAESALADVLQSFEAKLPDHIKLAYLPNNRMVKLRLTGRGADEKILEDEVDKQFGVIKKVVAEWLVATEDLTLAEIVGKLLDEQKKFLATAESCTGGYIAHLLTSRSGSSSSFKGSVVSYANDVKEDALGVQHKTLVTYGAVSEETVVEMVKGALSLMKVDYALATSGIMGPTGGTKEKPVGTVWIGVGNNNRVEVKKHFVHMDRKRNIEMTASIALNMLRQFLVANNE